MAVALAGSNTRPRRHRARVPAPAPPRIAEPSIGSDWPAPAGVRLVLARAGPADLATVRAHVAAACDACSLDVSGCDALALAADEVCTNVMTHAYRGAPGPLSVDIACVPRGGCAVTIVDAGPPFDPTAATDAAVVAAADAALATRPLGGLGWYLVRRSVHALRYARVAAHNVVVLERRAPVPPTPVLLAVPPSPAMQISTDHHGAVTVVSVTGSLDALTADMLAAALAAQVGAGRTRLVASFAGLEYTSSAGLRVLLATLKDTRQQGGDLRLAEVNARVSRVLDLSGFTSILKCFPDVPSAVASFVS